MKKFLDGTIIFDKEEVEVIESHCNITNSYAAHDEDLVIFREKRSHQLYEGWWQKDDTFLTLNKINEENIPNVIKEWEGLK